MDQLTIAAFLSVIANRLIEAFVAPIKQRFPEADMWWLIYVAWGVGALLSVLAKVNLFVALLPDLHPTAGLVLSAIVIGGGANLLADLFPAIGKLLSALRPQPEN